MNRPISEPSCTELPYQLPPCWRLAGSESSAALAALATSPDAFSAREATILRDGQRLRISAEQLDPGDVILVEAGDRVEELSTLLLRKMDVFARWITALILLGAGLLLVYGYFVRHHPFEELFMTVVGRAVAAIGTLGD